MHICIFINKLNVYFVHVIEFGGIIMIKKVVLTGGPCAGKSTAIAKISKVFTEKGYEVLVVPETATEIINMGIKPFGDNKINMYDFQKFILSHQLEKERLIDEYINLNENKNILVIYDRGIIDNMAYVPLNEFDKLLKEFNITKSNLFTRYDSALHLLTAAKGTDFYTIENNSAGSEGKEEAIILDDKILESYLGFPRLRIIDNSTNFESKIEKVIKEISNVLGNAYVQKQYKYLIDFNTIDYKKLERVSRKFVVKQKYNVKNNEEIMVRKMSFDDEDLYFLRIKSNTNKPSERIIKEKVISEKDYDYLHDSFDGNEITKIRYCFSYHDIDFRLDIFDDIALLEVEGEYDNIIFPDFFRVLEDVTEDEKYRNYNLSKDKRKKNLNYGI